MSDGRTAEYAECGSTRRKKNETKVMPKVPAASKSRKSPVLPGKVYWAKMEKKNALRPNAANGKAVAVPRWFGQLRAEVFTAAENAQQPPNPVQKE